MAAPIPREAPGYYSCFIYVIYVIGVICLIYVIYVIYVICVICLICHDILLIIIYRGAKPVARCPGRLP